MNRLALLAAPLAAAAVAAGAVAPVPAQAAVLAEDTFSTAVTTGWGPTWSVLQGPATAFRVEGDAGLITTPAGYGYPREIHLPGTTTRDVDVTVAITLPKLQTSTTTSQNWVVVRRQAEGRNVRVGIGADGAGGLTIAAQTQAFEQVARDVKPAFGFEPGTYHLRVLMQGANPSVLRTKVWRAGTAEPAAWLQETRTDKGPQVEGTVGLRTLAVNSSTPVVSRFEDVVVNEERVPMADMSQWEKVFEDDFSGTGLNTTAWSAFNGPGHVGNGLRRPAQVKVENGNLVITAEMIDGVLNSGGIAHRAGYTYGRFEFRVRTDRDPSGATSGVVLTWPQAGGWPVNGENDIYETGSDPDRTPFYSFIHFGETNQQLFAQHFVDGSQWHDMAMEWDADAIKFYRDGELVYTTTDREAVPDVAHRAGIQLDGMKQTMTGVVRMEVDHLRIYKRVS